MKRQFFLWFLVFCTRLLLVCAQDQQVNTSDTAWNLTIVEEEYLVSSDTVEDAFGEESFAEDSYEVNPCDENNSTVNFGDKDNDCGGLLPVPNGTLVYWIWFDQVVNSSSGHCLWVICSSGKQYTRLYVEYLFRADHDHVTNILGICDGCLVFTNGTVSGGENYPLSTKRHSYDFVFTSNIVSFTFPSDVKETLLKVHYRVFNENPGCSKQRFRSTDGVIATPGYPAIYAERQICEWEIDAPIGHRVEFNTTDFNTTSNCGNKQDDILQIIDGYSSAYPSITHYTSRIPPPSTFSSFSNNVGVRLISFNCPERHHGFKLVWRAQPIACNVTLNDSSGVIVKPDFPQYQALVCSWTINVNLGSVIRFTFLEFSMRIDQGSGEECENNYIQIKETRNDGDENAVGTFCSNTYPTGSVQTSSNVAVVTLQLSELKNASRHSLRREFRLSYEAGFKGVIESINYPLFYPPNLDCIWSIDAGEKNVVILNITHINLEPLSAPFGIRVYETDQNHSTRGRLVKEIQYNSTPPINYTSTGQMVSIMFKTNDALYKFGTGFRLHWIADGKNNLKYETEGVVYSENYNTTKLYPSESVQRWKIVTRPNSKIRLNIHDWEIEPSRDCIYDGLKVFAGPDEKNFNLLVHLCGTGQLPVIVSSDFNTLLVMFYSDKTENYKGFNASYKEFFEPTEASCETERKFQSISGHIYSPPIISKCSQETHIWKITVHHNYIAQITIHDTEGEITAKNDISISKCRKIEMLITGNSNKYGCLISGTWEVYDVHPEKRLVSLLHCRLIAPFTITASSNFLKVKYTWNRQYTGSGFKAHFQQRCGAVLRQRQGIIQNPDKMTIINEGGNCSWMIAAPEAFNQIVLIFANTSWPVADYSCSTHYCHYIRVYEGNPGDDDHSRQLYRGCCSRVPEPLVSSGNNLTLEIVNADALLFTAYYFAVPKNCSLPLNLTNFVTNYKNGTVIISDTLCQETINENITSLVLEVQQGLPQVANFPNDTNDGFYHRWKKVGRFKKNIYVKFFYWQMECSVNCTKAGLKMMEVGRHEHRKLFFLCGVRQRPILFTFSSSTVDIISYAQHWNPNPFHGRIYQRSRLGCGEHLQNPYGQISSPNYPDSSGFFHCIWIIEVNPNYLAAITIVDVGLDEMRNGLCKSDRLNVRDGLFGSLIGIYCGRVNGITLNSSSNILTLELDKQNYHLERLPNQTSGVMLKYFQSCGANIKEKKGIIQYPDPGGDQIVNCSWTISTPYPNDHVVLVFTELTAASMSEMDACVDTYLVIKDDLEQNTFENSSRYQTYCNSMPAPFVSFKNTVTIQIVNGKDVKFTVLHMTLTAECERVLSGVVAEMVNVDSKSCQDMVAVDRCGPFIHAQWKRFEVTANNEPNCTTNFVGVHKGNMSGPLMNFFCQEEIQILRNVSNYYWSVYVELQQSVYVTNTEVGYLMNEEIMLETLNETNVTLEVGFDNIPLKEENWNAELDQDNATRNFAPGFVSTKVSIQLQFLLCILFQR